MTIIQILLEEHMHSDMLKDWKRTWMSPLFRRALCSNAVRPNGFGPQEMNSTNS